MKKCSFEIISNIRIADATYEMKLRCEDGTHDVKRPGQFINIKLDDFFLRRPISVCCWQKDEMTIIYKAVGKGTEAMSGYDAGKKLDILTPLGNGFDVSTAKNHRVIAIGGGAGVPPIYGLCRELVMAGIETTAVLGFNSAKDVFYEKEFHSLGIDVRVATADGSVGTKGFVTDVIKDLSCSYFYACGPEAMLRALDDKIDKDAGGQLSFEERMGCGFGACMGCSCITKYGSKRICKEGPVLERSEIIW